MKHIFSVEMKSKHHVRNISISDEGYERVLFEGDLGDSVEVSLVEGDVLEFIGGNGILRIGITESELRRILSSSSRKMSLSSEVGSSINTNTKREMKK